ncbi:TylF/MycF/NovP-related O-methyltransferase [Chryseolinea lacunae]|uniref:Class I SAM-dependent methyltransferase n=1 Tax=Chryseolinea lacunae TaxID=2801331 RepID=A0ABS1KXH0_9BACT|nr:TylF/MycF/NovP-related O-methyltransferase [Chryseolinea lacunae]MBL0744035.1 class I SAM-dependent methyltransferase [Chryseolinea lacunae]
MLRKIYNAIRGRKKAPKSAVQKSVPLDIGAFEAEVFGKVTPYTMTSIDRVKCLIDSVNYITKNRIEGDFVECGVWKGGSVMAMAYTLIESKDTSRKIHLYDTFDGMSAPTDMDEDLKGVKASERLASESKETSWGWAYSPIDEVQKNIASTGYPASNFNFIKGKAEDTIPSNVPSKIALLRLDTDWYESTRVEMEYLFPRLAKGGILIIDDYGHWKGCRKAIDEYLEKNKIQIFLSRIDYTGRVAVKLND